MSTNIVVRQGTDLREDQVLRYSFKERMCHWFAGLTYVYLLLTGLALFTPYLYWIAYVLGGGGTIRFWHPIVGVLFFIGVLWMQSLWGASMKMTDQDRKWNDTIKAYIANRDEQVAPAGQFNSGQKQFYWVMFWGAVVLLLTGIVMWFPELMPRGAHWVLPIVVFLHVVGALATIGAFIIHIYMGVFFVSGGLHGILWGRVPANWAKAHHRLWYEKIMQEGRGRG